MRTLFVYADFDWLDEPLSVGELGYESLRGSNSYSFKYDNDWLRLYGSLFLSADINNYPSQQHTQPDRDIFGCFGDALPDRWGRLLLNRREQILATEEYMIGKKEAQRIIEEVKAGVRQWKSLASRLGIAKREMDVFEQVYQRSLKVSERHIH